MPITTASTLAEWLIAVSANSGDSISNLKLQKLLYYAQAWHLALKDKPIFEEDFEAWIHGPVIPSVYRHFKSYGSGAICPSEPPTLSGEEPKFECPEIPLDVSEHMKDVLAAYGDLTAWQLEQLTHQESPWMDARGKLPPDASCKTVIAKNAMKEFYRGVLRGDS